MKSKIIYISFDNKQNKI